MAERGDQDRARSARLLLGRDATPEELRSGAVRAALRGRWAPPRPERLLQRLRRKLGALDYERAVADPLQQARASVLGDAARAAPRFLVRVDEFPHFLASDEPSRYGTEGFRRFHAIMAGAGVPYLIAALPRVSTAPLDPGGAGARALLGEEAEMLARISSDRVTLALHGLDHRTRFASPRRRSELCGLDAAATERLIEQGLAALEQAGLSPPEVFVPPYNRFDARQWSILARRFRVVCGGPESIGLLGFQRTPVWHGQAVYLPSYEPLYGHAREVLPAAERLIERRVGLWAPIVLHWGWEADEDWVALERLLEAIAPHTACWEDFLAAVAASAAEGG